MADYPTTSYKTQGLRSNVDESQHMSESGKTQSRRHGGQRFELTIEHPPQTKSEFMPVYAFLRSQQGQAQNFTIQLADKITQLGAVTGSPVVNGARLAGTTSIPIDGLVAGTADVWVAGDMINFNSHTKGYKITSANNDAGIGARLLESGDYRLLESGDKRLLEEDGQSTVTIFPPLIEDVADNESVKYGATFTMTVRQKGDIQQYEVEPPNIYAFDVNLVEYIS